MAVMDLLPALRTTDPLEAHILHTVGEKQGSGTSVKMNIIYMCNFISKSKIYLLLS